ncbi:MAG: serine/threonine protein kinase [Deltaproteobacteria bacterium]|nr:serine/threonine protein kinase [Deltaproteobacteria bacterium]
MARGASNAAQLPAKIGRHEVLGHLADGGMAEIFLGKEPDGRPVVIKRIMPHLARQGTFVAMFIDEARIGSLVHHPNVVEVYELGQVGADLFMVMEYLAGESVLGLLRRMLARDEQLALALGAYIVAEACAGLHCAHQLADENGTPLGLVHRDISPSNLFVTYDGEVKVLDFGIATAAHRLTRTATGSIKGKFSYMSPEQCMGEPLDRRSDIFSLSVVLYELTTGRRLFKRPNELLVLKAVTEDPIPRPRRELPDYPEVLERIAMKGLSRERDRRHSSALELREELLAAMSILGFTGNPRDALVERMNALFSERVAEKRTLLRHLRAGTELGDMPAAEVDENVELPQMHEHVASARPSITRTATVSRGVGSRTWVVVLVALLLLGVGGGAAWWWQQERGNPVAEAEVPATLPAVVMKAEPAPTAPAAPTRFVVRVESVPPGATVKIDGESLGAAPLDHTFEGAGRHLLTLELGGYTSVTQELDIDRDQRVLVPLAAVPTAPPKAKPAVKKKKPQQRKPDPFGRFD